MPNTNYRHSRYRRFLKLAKMILGLVLLLLEIITKILDLLL